MWRNILRFLCVTVKHICLDEISAAVRNFAFVYVGIRRVAAGWAIFSVVNEGNCSIISSSVFTQRSRDATEKRYWSLKRVESHLAVGEKLSQPIEIMCFEVYFVRSFARSLVDSSFFYSFVRSLVCLLARSLVRSCVSFGSDCLDGYLASWLAACSVRQQQSTKTKPPFEIFEQVPFFSLRSLQQATNGLSEQPVCQFGSNQSTNRFNLFNSTPQWRNCENEIDTQRQAGNDIHTDR